MLKPEIETALNRQINSEQCAAQEYLAMSAHFESRSLAGFARYMRHQAEEESEHAMRLFDYLVARGGRVSLEAVAAPPAEFSTALDVFKAARSREQANTRNIHELYRLARDVDDHATQTMLHWFIDEQVEEEQWCDEAVDLLQMAGDDSAALLMLDQRYGERAGGSGGS